MQITIVVGIAQSHKTFVTILSSFKMFRYFGIFLLHLLNFDCFELQLDHETYA